MSYAGPVQPLTRLRVWPPERPRGRRADLLFALALGAMLLAGCAPAGADGSGGPGGAHALQVIAAESFWGSLATQLGGSHVSVTSIVTDPNADPHEYESSTSDARAFAAAQYVIVNGAGYDTWAQKLLDANPVDGRKVMSVAALLGKREGDNPHFWYNPDVVERVADRISADYQALDPADSAYFTQQRAVVRAAFQPYHDRIAAIKAHFAGQRVGATESIFVYMANALGLDLISPPTFMQAVSEGNDPPVAAVAQFQQQITQRQITLLVYNLQTATAVTNNLKALAAQQHIPTVGISETMQPPTATFQAWQDAQLQALQLALQAQRAGG